MSENVVHVHIHLHQTDERVEQIMSEQSQLRAQQEHTLQRIAQLEAKSDAEHAQISDFVQEFKAVKAELAELKSQKPGEPYDPSVIDAAFDRLGIKVEAIFTPDPAPAEPEPEAPAEPSDQGPVEGSE